VLFPPYPGQDNNLATSNLPILSVYADKDGLATLEEIADSRQRLPARVTFFEVTGGNHAVFDWYGDQNGESAATKE